MKLLITTVLFLAGGFAVGWLMAASFEPPVSYIFSAILGFIYGRFVAYPMFVWSTKK